MIHKEYQVKKVHMGRLEHQSDLIKSLTAIAESENIEAGRVSVIGAVSCGEISYYDQQTKEYQTKIFEESLEIVNCSGNISLKNGQPIIHAHISFSNRQGEVFGGHLEEGTIIFAGEYIIEEFSGQPLQRDHDHQTGLPLWQEK
ncbi:MAG: PPC domain-containing DNA-binding protein [Bacillota bacterium]